MATGQRCGQRHAVTVDDQVVIGTGAGAVDWRTAGQWTTAKSADVAGVYDPGRPVELPEGVELPEHLAMQPIPHAGRVPVAQPPPRRDAGAAHLLRQQPPWYARHEHEEDGRERDAVVNTRTSNPLMYAFRQQRFQHRPEPIIDMQRLSHAAPLASVLTSSANPGTAQIVR
jgi:predicted component of type VI protein secretion system